ncbi:succinyl-diaminopimelate desuccinylase [Nocardioides sp.]|uniref:succinyl-diaminopimelate desuccinylase n=1 Tax=Nocardioides sp. TaxID=35761 RepID=UPI002BAA46D4|nr:succinyl-diaminopimelate desuccinylase [Nocardioides sp.]HVX55038.1 succinyl-diaminopimelate desuccinylase [Nocardioides sp.]
MNELSVPLPVSLDVVSLTMALVNIESVSHREGPLADSVEAALRDLSHLRVERFGNTVVARTESGHPERVIIAGHLDTVPENDNLLAYVEMGKLFGLGACDMKGGIAVMLKTAALGSYRRDVTFVFYDGEEVASEHNGLRKLAESHPHLLEADLAILMEPSNAGVEAGCQGTMRVEVRVPGERAHSARSWTGVNAIHRAGELLRRLEAHEPRQPVIDGLTYHEGLNAVFVSGGVAGNVIPDECVLTVNYRFAPDRTEEEAEAFLREFFAPYDVTVTDSAPGARPGLDRPAAKAFLEAVGAEVGPKFGWTDVARFTVLGVPAVNYGPGDPLLAHRREEYVPTAQLTECEHVLKEWLRA